MNYERAKEFNLTIYIMQIKVAYFSSIGLGK
jgi:hypothetical protein